MRSPIIFLSRTPRHLLRMFFHFDKWHCVSVFEKKYVKDIVAHLNGRPQKDRDSVAEIGTGLGDIIRKLDFNSRIGYDSEQNVVAASRFLSRITGDKTSFAHFVFPAPLNGRFNVILMVNWIHHIEPAVLKKYIEKYVAENLLENGCIIIDTVQSPNYKHNHDIRFLTSDLACKFIKIGSYANQREIYAILK